MFALRTHCFPHRFCATQLPRLGLEQLSRYFFPPHRGKSFYNVMSVTRTEDFFHGAEIRSFPEDF